MQQTEKLNLNLIEGSDPVDWEVLNDNFKSLDKTVSTVSVLSQATADFIGSAKNCCIAFGSYTGTGTYGVSAPNLLTPGFMPVLVIISDKSAGGVLYTLLRGVDVWNAAFRMVWGTDRLTWYTEAVGVNRPAEVQLNGAGHIYTYVILGCSAV